MPRSTTPHGAGRRKRSERDRLGVVGGLAALSLDAMASIAYGPEAIVLVLALAGVSALRFTLPISLAIVLLLTVLTWSYRQVIAAFPTGGGAYGVAKTHLGRTASLVAGSSLIIDYVLNVAVSVAAGVAALASAFPGLLPYRTVLCLVVLGLITAVNYRGIAHSARTFIGPTVVYIGAIMLVIVVGLIRSSPAVPHPPAHAEAVETVGLFLLLRAFANGCVALTGVEAIANSVPSFKDPRVKHAQRAEIALGALLGVMLIGVAVLIGKFSVGPVPGVTVLSQVTEASLGDGPLYYLVQFSTVVLLALAANTSFGGLPVLAHLLAKDNNLPHLFAMRAERQVHRYGIAFLAITAALLLIAVEGEMNHLVPLFAIGVFIGFTLSQFGMVRHWWRERPRGWRAKAALNGFGGFLTMVAAIVITVTKVGEGGWLIVVALPFMVFAMECVNRSYARFNERLKPEELPPPPRPRRSVVVVPVHTVDRLTCDALASALSLGDRVVAVNVAHPEDEGEAHAFVRRWEEWDPEVELVQIYDPHYRIAEPIITFLEGLRELHVFVLIAETEPEHFLQRLLKNQRGAVLAATLRRTRVVVCRMRFRIGSPED
ncbi:APC family permease [Sinosporangium siamense]|uniref:Amino acid permease n=1 Tax=Sinosporangium siamense TaxID=1367973 RepID=A0A919RCK8_9ACTN|nr:APC family permease [Sinosporangium siamense]GII91207.1 putative amino acid permease [Sinosporangium siamense]